MPSAALVMGAVDRQFVSADDSVEQGVAGDGHGMPGPRAWAGLLMLEAIRDAVGDMLDQRAAEHDVQQLLPAAYPEDGKIAPERAFGDLPFEPRAPVLRLYRGVACLGAEEPGIDIEGAAGHDHAVELLEIGFRKIRLVTDGDGKPAGLGDAGHVVLPDRVPRHVRIGARLFRIERQANQGAS